MNCLKCELMRARLKADALLIVGFSLQRIAAYLSNCYGENYYANDGVLYRASKLAPHIPHVIKDCDDH